MDHRTQYFGDQPATTKKKEGMNYVDDNESFITVSEEDTAVVNKNPAFADCSVETKKNKTLENSPVSSKRNYPKFVRFETANSDADVDFEKKLTPGHQYSNNHDYTYPYHYDNGDVLREHLSPSTSKEHGLNQHGKIPTGHRHYSNHHHEIYPCHYGNGDIFTDDNNVRKTGRSHDNYAPQKYDQKRNQKKYKIPAKTYDTESDSLDDAHAYNKEKNKRTNKIHEYHSSRKQYGASSDTDEDRIYSLSHGQVTRNFHKKKNKKITNLSHYQSESSDNFPQSDQSNVEKRSGKNKNKTLIETYNLKSDKPPRPKISVEPLMRNIKPANLIYHESDCNYNHVSHTLEPQPRAKYYTAETGKKVNKNKKYPAPRMNRKTNYYISSDNDQDSTMPSHAQFTHNHHEKKNKNITNLHQAYYRNFSKSGNHDYEGEYHGDRGEIGGNFYQYRPREVPEKHKRNPPKFNENNISKSLKEFNLFFQLYQMTEDERYHTLLECVPWSYISLYVESHHYKEQNFYTLKKYLEGYATPLYSLQRLIKGKFTMSKPVQEIFMAANIIHSVPLEDIHKLALYVAMPKEAQNHFRSKLHLPLEILKRKMIKFWDESTSANTHLLLEESHSRRQKSKLPPNANNVRITHNGSFKPSAGNTIPKSTGPDLRCFYHRKYGADAFKCEGKPCPDHHNIKFQPGNGFPQG